MGGSCSSQNQRRNVDHSDGSNQRQREGGGTCRLRSFSSVVGRLCSASRVSLTAAVRFTMPTFTDIYTWHLRATRSSMMRGIGLSA